MAATDTPIVIPGGTWTSPPLAVFEAMAATIEARVGPPSERDLDSNGLGRFDTVCVRFACGLEVGLSRFHLGGLLRTIDPTTEPSRFEVHACPPDLAHVAFHLALPVDTMSPWTDPDGVPLATVPPPTVVVMRTDDNGNDVEVTRVTNRCEAAAIVREYEARGHKQTYWIHEAGLR